MTDNQENERPHPLLETIAVVAVALSLALLVQWLIVKPYRIPSESMVPTLVEGQRILVNRVEGRFGSPERGDVVVFNPPSGAGDDECGVEEGQRYGAGDAVYTAETGAPDDTLGMACPKPTPGKFSDAYVKRLIGMPGDRLKIIKGHAFINGQQLDEPYINGDDNCDDPESYEASCSFPVEITIPAGHYFMMGDNRNASDDSRFWGPIPAENVIGEAFATYWPPQRIGGL
ncbi:MAG: signal peptidase I [Actinobacteria bacterium]|nr:signal peptidase I [Actinomycetota bacterium]